MTVCWPHILRLWPSTSPAALRPRRPRTPGASRTRCAYPSALARIVRSTMGVCMSVSVRACAYACMCTWVHQAAFTSIDWIWRVCALERLSASVCGSMGDDVARPQALLRAGGCTAVVARSPHRTVAASAPVSALCARVGCGRGRRRLGRGRGDLRAMAPRRHSSPSRVDTPRGCTSPLPLPPSSTRSTTCVASAMETGAALPVIPDVFSDGDRGVSSGTDR